MAWGGVHLLQIQDVPLVQHAQLAGLPAAGHHFLHDPVQDRKALLGREGRAQYIGTDADGILAGVLVTVDVPAFLQSVDDGKKAAFGDVQRLRQFCQRVAGAVGTGEKLQKVQNAAGGAMLLLRHGDDAPFPVKSMKCDYASS